MTEKIKILFLSANPRDISQIRLGEELREVDERIRLGDHGDQLELISHFAVRPKDLRQALLRHKPHILHFSGHGSKTAGIVLEDNNGQTEMVSVDALASLFRVIKDNLRVVILNACYSGPQAKGISKVVDCTIGMTEKIGDHSAIVFSSAFYEGLAFGRSVEEAFGLGINALEMECPAEAKIPKLKTKPGTTAAAVYLATHQPEGSSEKPPQPAATQDHSTLRVEGNNMQAGGDITIAKNVGVSRLRNQH